MQMVKLLSRRHAGSIMPLCTIKLALKLLSLADAEAVSDRLTRQFEHRVNPNGAAM
jgi:hypothetical protein